MNIFSVERGNAPILLAQPHQGTHVPAEILETFNQTGKALADTDWHIHRLYENLIDDITVVQSHIHRYVIDANRAPEDESLYPGQNTTSLCPITDFDGLPIYHKGLEPDVDQIKQRQQIYHQPYHDALATELQRLTQQHKSVILFDCHSIRSKIPFLFDGVLPDFNIGSFEGRSCNAKVENSIKTVCENAKGYSSVVNGRFKGGWTTRFYGQSGAPVQSIQLELAQSTYMQESAPWQYDRTKADQLRVYLKRILSNLIEVVS